MTPETETTRQPPGRTADLRASETPGNEAAPSWVWLLFFLGLLALRLRLPFTDTDTMVTHTRIVESLLSGQNWGRQALVGAFEFPPLPSLALLLARLIGKRLHLDGGQLLVAFAQAWSACYLLRTPREPRRSWACVVGAGALLWLPDVRNAFTALDPNWIGVIPLCSVVYHSARWQRQRALRDVVLCAVNCGLLALMGWAGIAFALAVLATMCHDLRRLSDVPRSEQGGIKLLIWAPFCYCLLVWLLWNWLIMGSLFFGLGHLLEAIQATTPDTFLSGLRAGVTTTSLLVPAGLLTLVACLGGGAYGPTTCLLAALAAVTLARAVLNALGLFVPGATLYTLLLSAIGLLLPVLLLERPQNRWRFAAGAGFLLAALVGGIVRPAPAYAEEGAYIVPFPPVEAMTSWIDRFWSDSRIIVTGVRAPAIYPDREEKRFQPHLDFQESVFLEQARDEQLHLLVPPRNGAFYARRRSVLSDIHEHGRPWLLLEKQWPDGWQLWRCVVPPDGESKLKNLES